MWYLIDRKNPVCRICHLMVKIRGFDDDTRGIFLAYSNEKKNHQQITEIKTRCECASRSWRGLKWFPRIISPKSKTTPKLVKSQEPYIFFGSADFLDCDPETPRLVKSRPKSHVFGEVGESCSGPTLCGPPSAASAVTIIINRHNHVNRNSNFRW